MPRIVFLILTTIIVLPIMVTFTVVIGMANIKLSVRNKLIPWDLGKTEKFDVGFFESISQKLVKAGFEYENDYKIDDCMPLSKSKNANKKEIYMRRFIHKHLATSAQIYHTIICSRMTSAGQTITKVTSKKGLGLDTFFQGGLSVCSTTQVEPRIFEETNSIYLAYTNFSELDKLIDEHINTVNRSAQEYNLSNEVVDLPSELFTNKMLKSTYMHQVERKILKYDEVHGCFKFTLRGATGAFMKLLKFDLFEKKKLQQQANKFVSYSQITKSRAILPSVIYYINFTVSIWFIIVHMRLLYGGEMNRYQLMFLLASEVAGLICFIITILYKIIKSRRNDNLTL